MSVTNEEAVDLNRIPAPRGTWAAAAIVIALVVLQALALLGYWLAQTSSDDKPDGDESPTTSVVGDPIKLGDVAAKVRISLVEGTAAPSPGYPGTVTRSFLTEGATISSGQPMFTIDGVTRYAYHSTQPFYRVLKLGDVGPDVVQLRQLLNDLGLGPISVRRDSYDHMVAAAVTKMSMKIGMPAQAATTVNLGPVVTTPNNASPTTTTPKLATPTTTTTTPPPPTPQRPTTIGPVFDPQWTVWIPAAYMAADSTKVRVGLPLPATGEPMFSSARSLGRVVVNPTTPIPSASVPVDRVLDLPAVPAKFPYVSGDAAISGGGSANLLRFAVARQKPGEPLADVEIDGVIRSVSSRSTVSVPVTAIFTDTNSVSCVVKAGAKGARDYFWTRVEVVGSSSASGVAAVSGLRQGDVIVTNPGPSGLTNRRCGG